MVRALVAWFARVARDLPWRRGDPADGRRDPYRVLVSEFMLQQTQVARVVERYGAFLERFPTVRALAAAPLDDVLALWAGLGYYRRAGYLHAAAKMIVARHAGRVPGDVETLATLPGIGRYTAGAVASTAFGVGSPAVDGNVARVLVRIEGRDLPGGGPALAWAWGRAESIAAAAGRLGAPGACNEALMELGATVCMPRNPACGRCPVRLRCRARSLGIQGDLPRPRTAPKRRSLHAIVVEVRDAGGRYLVERRRDDGLWGGLWQLPTVESGEKHAAPSALRALGLPRGLSIGPRRDAGAFSVTLSHREVSFRVVRLGAAVPAEAAASLLAPPAHAVKRAWVPPRRLGRLGLSNAQRRAVALLRETRHSSSPRRRATTL